MPATQAPATHNKAPQNDAGNKDETGKNEKDEQSHTPADTELTLSPPHNHQSDAVRRAIMPWLGGADAVMYVLIGVVFLGGALAMLVYSVWVFVQGAFLHPTEGSTFADNVVTLINDLLLVMIIMEVLRTIGSYIEERGASLRPFLFIGAISATRRILAIGAEMSIHGDKLTADEFNRRIVDLCVNAGVILAIVIALYLLSSRNLNATDE